MKPKLLEEDQLEAKGLTPDQLLIIQRFAHSLTAQQLAALVYGAAEGFADQITRGEAEGFAGLSLDESIDLRVKLRDLMRELK